VPENVSRLFAVCEDLGLDLAQPAFTPASRCAHPIAWQHDGFQVRFTNFVDPAAPVFSREMLARVMPTLDAADAGSLLGRVWPQLTRLGRVAIVDATPVGRAAGTEPPAGAVEPLAAWVAAASHFADQPDDAMLNFGGLLESGDALCLSERALDVDALLNALMRSCRALPLDASRFTRYLARHLDFAGTAGPAPQGFGRAAIKLALERELAGVGLKFNLVAQPANDAAAAAPRFEPVPDRTAPGATLPTVQVQQLTQALAEARLAAGPDAARQIALREADLRDLRSRYEAVVTERDRQAELLSALAGQLARAQRLSEALQP
jgi:hypothetical protein